jgi:beta-lactamase regulating signal transducer with metallopeptidase domain
VIASLMIGLVKTNLAAAAAILVVLVLRRPIRTRFGARAAYALWMAPLLAAVAANLPHPAAASFVAPVVPSVGVTADGVIAQAPAGFATDWSVVFMAAWVAGAFAMAALLMRRQLRFVASLGRLELVAGASPRLFRAQNSGVGPAVIGVLRPRIIAPADFERCFAVDEQALILAHERTHLLAGDAAINAAVCVAQCLGWFNPLVHVAARLLRIDQELACDAAVIAQFPEARRRYAELLLKTQLIAEPLPLGCNWPAAAEHPLKERITMLKSPPPARTSRVLGIAAVAGLSLAGACAAWSAQPGAPRASGGLEPEDARKLAGEHGQILCKPDAARELHNCRILQDSPWAKIATAADVRREYPPQARLAGLTADVLLRCRPDRARARLNDCRATRVETPVGQATPPGARQAFGAAAIRVAGLYRLRDGGVTRDFTMPDPMYMVIQFNDHPVMPGGPPADPAPTHAPPGLPIPAEGGR